MLWFLLLGFIGFCVYKIYRHYWYKSLQKQILRYQDTEYKTLSPLDKKNLKQLVNTVLNTGSPLEEETNKIVTLVFNEMEKEKFNAQEGMRLRETKDQQG